MKIKFFNWIMYLLFFLLGVFSLFTIAYYYSNFYEEENFIENNYKISFEGNTLTNLNNFYKNTTDLEFGFCLIGNEKNGIVYITDLDNFILGTNSNVTTNPCLGEKYVGNIHKHPIANGLEYWKPSHADASISYKKFNNGHKIYMIMYDINKFNLMTEDNWYPGKKIEVNTNE